MIHTFGDSHALYGWRNIKDIPIAIHHLGPKLMRSFASKGVEFCDLKNYDILDGDTVVFCFGEIDCRVHMHKIPSADTGMFIENLVVSYLFSINKAVSSLSPKKVKVCVYNVVPPVIKDLQSEHNAEYPFNGTDEDRKYYVTFMNSCLKRYCDLYGYTFIDIYDSCVDEFGFLLQSVSDGSVHVDRPEPIERFIFNNLTLDKDLDNPLVREFNRTFFNKFEPPLTVHFGTLSRWESVFFIARKLLLKNKAVNIVETGCSWTSDWKGQGCSTQVWSWIISKIGGTLKSLDISPEHARECAKLNPLAQIIIGDSIESLLKIDIELVDFLYLDSYDHNPPYGLSELHAIGELACCYEKLPSGCLIAVDDCKSKNNGKHNFIDKFFKRMDIKPSISGYMCVWEKPND